VVIARGAALSSAISAWPPCDQEIFPPSPLEHPSGAHQLVEMEELCPVAVAKKKPPGRRGRPKKRALFSRANCKPGQGVKAGSPELNSKIRESGTDVQNSAGEEKTRFSTNNYIGDYILDFAPAPTHIQPMR
jgi:hypothetical protein